MDVAVSCAGSRGQPLGDLGEEGAEEGARLGVEFRLGADGGHDAFGGFGGGGLAPRLGRLEPQLGQAAAEPRARRGGVPGKSPQEFVVALDRLGIGAVLIVGIRRHEQHVRILPGDEPDDHDGDQHDQRGCRGADPDPGHIRPTAAAAPAEPLGQRREQTFFRRRQWRQRAALLDCRGQARIAHQSVERTAAQRRQPSGQRRKFLVQERRRAGHGAAFRRGRLVRAAQQALRKRRSEHLLVDQELGDAAGGNGSFRLGNLFPQRGQGGGGDEALLLNGVEEGRRRRLAGWGLLLIAHGGACSFRNCSST